MLISFRMLLLVSCLGVSSLYAPSQQSPRHPASRTLCMGIAKWKMLGSAKQPRSKHRFTSPAPGSWERKRERKMFKKLRLAVEEMLASI